MNFSKILRRTLRWFVVIIATVVAGFYIDRHFVRFYKTEVRPAILSEFEANVLPVFDGKTKVNRQTFLKSFGTLACEAEKTAIKECGFTEKTAPEYSLLCVLIAEALKEANFTATNNVEAVFSGTWAKNDSIKKFSERPYYAKIFAEFIPSEIGGETHYADTEKNFIIVSCLIDINNVPHFDFPMSVNGKSLWQLCGFREINGTLTLENNAKEKILKFVKQQKEK